jgi:hypothetical protein
MTNRKDDVYKIYEKIADWMREKNIYQLKIFMRYSLKPGFSISYSPFDI